MPVRRSHHSPCSRAVPVQHLPAGRPASSGGAQDSSTRQSGRAGTPPPILLFSQAIPGRTANFSWRRTELYSLALPVHHTTSCCGKDCKQQLVVLRALTIPTPHKEIATALQVLATLPHHCYSLASCSGSSIRDINLHHIV